MDIAVLFTMRLCALGYLECTDRSASDLLCPWITHQDILRTVFPHFADGGESCTESRRSACVLTASEDQALWIWPPWDF